MEIPFAILRETSQKEIMAFVTMHSTQSIIQLNDVFAGLISGSFDFSPAQSWSTIRIPSTDECCSVPPGIEDPEDALPDDFSFMPQVSEMFLSRSSFVITSVCSASPLKLFREYF